MDKTILLLLIAVGAMLLSVMLFTLQEYLIDDGIVGNLIVSIVGTLAIICCIISILIFIIVLIRCAVWLVDIAVPHLADFLTWSLS